MTPLGSLIITTIDMMDLANFFIVENHHEVLVPWATLRQKLPKAPRLITFDHHTDTSVSFRHHLRHLWGDDFVREQKKKLDDISYQDPQSVRKALEFLAHDEHVVTALKKDILSSAWVIAHNARDTDVETYRQHQIACYSVGRGSEKTATRAECDQVLESPFLEGALLHFEQILKNVNEEPLLSQPYILDIDMDVFNTRQSLRPENADVFQCLIQGAALITVAREPRHFVMCSLEKDHTAEAALVEWQQRFLGHQF